LLVVLKQANPEVGVRMPRSAWAIEPREEATNEAESTAAFAGRGNRRNVKGAQLMNVSGFTYRIQRD
jgi:hypothetical protein